ncbi:hypothetical protein B5X24_HaOG207886 [Helicoverpa armigera]|uniref:BED-type domain-containing protein n=1 Tax=Helicoverpa armigera TaxID=29058 RepID=A0A2W1BH36_HELAM|nr:hypothetical protein B5X24_HaOG207886 [Helicoverpa armigera]
MKFEPEQLPEWASIYFIKHAENEMKCNLCDITLKVDEKSLELLEHLKVDHKDIYDLHKDNPEATVGFRIEFLHLNMLKDDGDPKTQPVILGEVCEATTETIEQKEEEVIAKPEDNANLHFVLLDGKKKSKRIGAVVFTSETDTPYAIKTEEIYASDRDYEEVTDSPTQKLRRSWIWSYFDRVSSTQARCKLCDRHICHGGNATGNMNRHLKMIHHKTACNMTCDQSWVWKVFEEIDSDFYSCKICQYKCLKCSDIDKSMSSILNHLKLEHGVISGDQIITGADVEGEETFRFGLSNRGHLVVHVGEHKFIKHECYKKKVRWTCSKRIQLGCRASITTHDTMIVRSFLVHNHDAQKSVGISPNK